MMTIPWVFARYLSVYELKLTEFLIIPCLSNQNFASLKASNVCEESAFDFAEKNIHKIKTTITPNINPLILTPLLNVLVMFRLLL